MSRNKVLERAKVSIDSGRSPFDLSEESCITSLCGEINVPYIQPVVKGTKGTINRSVIISRTADVVSPAFHRVTEHFDFFLVPIHALWRQWENWKLNINDLQDTNTVRWNDVINTPNLNLPTYAPRLDYVHFISNFMGVDEGSFSNTAAEVRAANDALRMADWFQLCPSLMGQLDYGTPSKIMSVFFPAAYQKVYFEHYRNTAYESNNPYAYNFDWLYTSDKQGLLTYAGSQNPKDKSIVKELFKVRRVNYRNDYFHNLYPSLNYVLSLPTGADGFSVPSNIGQLLVGGGNSSFDSGTVYAQGQIRVGTATSNSRGGAFSGQLSENYSAGISVQSIRAAFALDKLMRASAYAPKHVREQYKAQFGVDGHVYDSDMRSQRIGSFESSIVFQEVTNMAQSASSNLGDLGAKGLGSSQSEKPIEFYAEYDSILICMHYFLPRAKYDSDGIFEWNTFLTRDSFFVKAFENLGLRPFYLHNLDGRLNDVMGFTWTVPNYVYKIKPDLNHCEFKENFLTYTLEYDSGEDEIIVQSRVLSDQLSTFVPHTLNHYAEDTTQPSWPWSAEYFKVAPEDLDNVFRNKVPVDHRLGFYQFYTAYRIMCAVVAPMSVHGQPSL